MGGGANILMWGGRGDIPGAFAPLGGGAISLGYSSPAGDIRRTIAPF
jgi:hypothetical protein